MVSRTIPVDSFDLVIFGGTGDLARRKILPGLYRRFWSGQMPDDARIVGASRREMSDEDYQSFVRDAISEFALQGVDDTQMIEDFVAKTSYVSIDAKGDGGWDVLRKARLKRMKGLGIVPETPLAPGEARKVMASMKYLFTN